HYSTAGARPARGVGEAGVVEKDRSDERCPMQPALAQPGEQHCCEDMRREVERVCDQHPDRFACPDCLIHYSPPFREVGLIVHDGGSSSLGIRFCPWCGTSLPESPRDNETL